MNNFIKLLLFVLVLSPFYTHAKYCEKSILGTWTIDLSYSKCLLIVDKLQETDNYEKKEYLKTILEVEVLLLLDRLSYSIKKYEEADREEKEQMHEGGLERDYLEKLLYAYDEFNQILKLVI